MVSFQQRIEQTVGARRVRFICAPNQYYMSFMRSALFWLAAIDQIDALRERRR